MISILFLSIGKTARRNLLDKFPANQIAIITSSELLKRCTQAFVVRQNTTLDRFCSFFRKQEQIESPQQFWIALNGLAANREFKGQTSSLVYDIFTLNMHSKTVQETLCTEQKSNPEESFQFAVAFEERVENQASYGDQNRDLKLEVKTDPISVCTITSVKVCFRCGASIFTPQYSSQCRAAKENCGKCGIVGHFARYYGKLKSRIQGGAQKKSNRNAARRNIYNVDGYSSNDSSVEATGSIVLTTLGIGEAPFLMKKNKINFTAKIDFVSPVTIFTTKDLKEILETNVLFARPIRPSEKNVDVNQGQSDLARFIQVNLKVRQQELKRTRNLVTPKGRSLVGRDCLAALQYQCQSNGLE